MVQYIYFYIFFITLLIPYNKLKINLLILILSLLQQRGQARPSLLSFFFCARVPGQRGWRLLFIKGAGRLRLRTKEGQAKIKASLANRLFSSLVRQSPIQSGCLMLAQARASERGGRLAFWRKGSVVFNLCALLIFCASLDAVKRALKYTIFNIKSI